jgi:hypothetical protein
VNHPGARRGDGPALSVARKGLEARIDARINSYERVALDVQLVGIGCSIASSGTAPGFILASSRTTLTPDRTYPPGTAGEPRLQP